MSINHSTALTLPNRTIHEPIPRKLLCVFHESYLANLSETFSKASHGGAHDLALDVGVTLLALYVLIYPPNYPQIGEHFSSFSTSIILNSPPSRNAPAGNGKDDVEYDYRYHK